MARPTEEALEAAVSCLNLHLDHFNLDEVALIHRAMHTAVTWQVARVRRSDTPAWSHSLTVGNDLAVLGAPADVIIAGYHHDDLEDLGKTAQDLQALYSDEAANLVVALTKTDEDSYVRQLVREGHANWWVLLIKAVDRRHNIRTADGFDANKREEYARETLALVATLQACANWVPDAWRERYSGVLDDARALAEETLHTLADARKSTTLPLTF